MPYAITSSTLFSDIPDAARVHDAFSPDAHAVLLAGDSAETLKTLPDGTAKLVITSPPYNIGKAYEQVTGLQSYLDNLEPIIDEVVRVLADGGSLC